MSRYIRGKDGADEPKAARSDIRGSENCKKPELNEAKGDTAKGLSQPYHRPSGTDATNTLRGPDITCVSDTYMT